MNKPMLRVWIHALAACLLLWGITHWLPPSWAFAGAALVVAALTILQYTAGYATGKNQGFDWAAKDLVGKAEDEARDSVRDLARVVRETAEDVEEAMVDTKPVVIVQGDINVKVDGDKPNDEP